MPAHMEVYEDGHLQLPGKVKCYNGENNIHGIIGGISELTVIHTTMTFSQTSMSLGTNRPGEFEINSINVMAGGLLEFTEDVPTELILSNGALYIAPTGVIKARKLTITADTVTVEQGGTINLDQTGYGTDGPGIYIQYIYTRTCL